MKGARLAGWSVIALVGLAWLPVAASAAPVVEVQLPNAQFGNLNQNDVDACKDAAGVSFSCGAVAVVNSFAFLQRRYPEIYDHSLIPDLNDNRAIDYDELKAAATEVAWLQNCDPSAGGSGVADIIRGKQAYIESRVPGVTTYKTQNSFATPSVRPKFDFLLKELQHGEDVEITLGYYGTITQGRIGGHVLTLTGLKWTDEDMNGNVDFDEATMTFIDPGTGGPGTKKIYFTFFLGGYLGTDYGMGGTVNCGTPPAPCRILAVIIEAAISESPILPVPGTLVLLATGAAALGVRARTARRLR